MKEITLHGQWLIRAPLVEVFNIITDFEKWPEYFPKVAESIQVIRREGNNLEIDVTVKSFGQKFSVRMKYQILPEKGFISDNENPKFGTSGHEEMLLSKSSEGTLIDYTYRVSIHKAWLRVVAAPLIRWYSMKYWEKAVISELRKALRSKNNTLSR
ncbi:MAG: SRPBCC family protein [Patescibacteria group bacterium]